MHVVYWHISRRLQEEKRSLHHSKYELQYCHILAGKGGCSYLSSHLCKVCPASRNQEGKSFKKQTLRGQQKTESPLILVLDLTVPLGFSGFLKLIFAGQLGWMPVPWKFSVPNVCWKATGGDIPLLPTLRLAFYQISIKHTHRSDTVPGLR